MKASKTTLIAGIGMVAVLAILLVIWWVNGRDQTWFYAAMALVAVSAFLPSFLGRKGKDQ